MIVQADTDTQLEMSMAKEIAETLHATYPGHLWAVTVRSGVAIIKDLFVSSLWGYILKLKDIQHDAGARTKAVKLAGGEILERARLERGQRQEGVKVMAVDGIADYTPLGVR